MVKLNMPLMSERAQKQLGNELIYKMKDKRAFVTGYSRPGRKNPFSPSATQLNTRMLCSLLIAWWLTMTQEQKDYWNDLVKTQKLKMSGWNLFYKKAMADLPTHLGLVGYWSFNKISNGTILDLSGNNNDGILKPTYPDDCPILTDSVNTRFGKANYFDGANDYIDCGSEANLNITEKITIEVWIKPKPNQEYCWDLVKGNYGVAGKVESHESSLNWSWQLRYGSPDSCCLGFQFNETGGGSKWVTVKQNLAVGQWHHIVGTYDGSSIKCYLNGKETDSNTLAEITGYENKLLIGNEGWANYFNGAIDEFKIYNRALSLGEIQKHYKFRI